MSIGIGASWSQGNKRISSTDFRVSLYVIMTLAGWDTGASAPLLPFLQRYYNVSSILGSAIVCFSS